MNDLIQYLSQFATERRFQLMTEIAAQRTRYLTVVLEDIYQPHNASAVLRTCDCLGIQDVHIIEKKNRYTLNPDVELGSAQWLTLYKHNQTDSPAKEAISALRSRGYRIVATTPHVRDVSPDDFDLLNGPAAIVFGTEMRGITTEILDLADDFIRIPMAGFTESYNISVSAAIILYTLSQKLRKSAIDWKLASEESDLLILEWLRKSVKHSDQLEKRYIFDNQKKDPCQSNP
ncbi:MAG: RNA methyltransferase [Bacteroidetes bacterium GWF2_49_14]|nr:MAG: RNA methyltransferase [Bacteroidetes bacterium GWF2_49_14]HBB91406.1 TrmH family RNA methyltransferase [Bacteroidales bacterium]